MKRIAMCLATAAIVSALPAHAAESAAASARRPARVAVPAANFLVEWRLQSADARPSTRGDVVITSGSAATGASGFGAGAVVVGTARPAAAQALRVANGKEGAIQFDRSETHTVYDMAWAGSASASAPSSASRSQQSGVQSHEEVIHRVDGLRVTPHWARGDTLLLDVALTHAAPASVSRNATAGARASHDVDFHSTVEASFDEWLTVASVGDGGDELQVRVTWR